MYRPGRRPFRLDAAILGAQKAGTTTLFARLALHPGVAPCRGKEPHHFAREDWREGMAAYERLFGRAGGRLTLDGSTTYGFARHAERVAERLQAHNPELRVIYLVREPVARITSAWRHGFERGWSPPSLAKALARDPALLGNTRYATCLRPYRERFGPDQVLVLPFEAVARRQDEVVARAARFLGLAPPPPAPPVRANRRAVPKRHHRHDDSPAMRLFHRAAPHLYGRIAKPALGPSDASLAPGQRADIRAELEDELATIERWTGLDLSAWRTDEALRS